MAENGLVNDVDSTVEPLRETEDIAMLLYKRGKEQEKQLAETLKREKETRGLLNKERERYQSAMAKVSSILPRKADFEQRILLKEGKVNQVQERIVLLDRFIDNCRLFLEKGNIYEAKVRETQDKINEVIVKEHENEQKLVVVYRRKDNLERLISRQREKHTVSKARYTDKLTQHREAVTFQQQVRNNIKDSINRAKNAYEKCVEIAPKVLELQKKVRLLEASIYGLEMKINSREDELKKIRKDKEFVRQEHDRLKLEQMIRLEKKMKKMKFK